MNKRSINNPLYQNYGHIKALSELLNMDTNDFINIVCFSGNVKVKVKSNNLVGIVQLIDKIKSQTGIIIRADSITIYGICQECKSKMKEEL